MQIYVINMGSNNAQNYHVGFVTTDFEEALKFISEHLIYGDDHQWCNHIYDRFSDMEVWENGDLLYSYGLYSNDKVNLIGEKETLSVDELREEVERVKGKRGY